MDVKEKLMSLYTLSKVALLDNKQFDKFKVVNYSSCNNGQEQFYYTFDDAISKRYYLQKSNVYEDYTDGKVLSCIVTTPDFGNFIEKHYNYFSDDSLFWEKNIFIPEFNGSFISKKVNKYFPDSKLKFWFLIIKYYLRIYPFFKGSFKKSQALVALKRLKNYHLAFQNITADVDIETIDKIEKDLQVKKNTYEDNILLQILEILNK